MKKLLAILLACGAGAQAGTLFLGMYPNWVAVFDEEKGQIVDHIQLETGLPTSLRLSQDRKILYATTNDHSGIEVIDVATHKVLNHFVLNTPTHHYRFNGGVPDPEGKLFYAITTEIIKQSDHYDIGKPKYTVIDLQQHKIAKTFDIAKEDENGNAGGGGRGGGFDISPDGKYLYQFRNEVVVLDSSDFKVVQRIDLAKPDLPGLENIGFGGQLDSGYDPGVRMSVFNSSDPVVHNRVFGFARFDLTTRKFDFMPIGPAPAQMSGLQVTPDKKDAYVIVSNGAHGNKRCEFWAFDMATDHMKTNAEVPCRTRFSFGMSADGKKLYIFAAGFEIEVYDAATLKYEKTWDLKNDITGAGMVVLP
jgi:DNA-binding beta-propeller fold protein YncE